MKHYFLYFTLCFSIGCSSTPIVVDLNEDHRELEGRLSYVSQDGDNQIIGEGTYLVHISPTTQVGPILGYASQKVDGFSSDLFIGGLEIRENLKTSGAIIPFVGANFSLIKASNDDNTGLNGNAFQIFAGGRTPLSDSAFLVTKVAYSKVSAGNDDQDNISTQVGLSVRY